MADDWQFASLGDLIDVKHGFAFEGEFIHDDSAGDVLLTPGNFAIGGGFKGDKLKYYDGPVPEEFVLHERDLLVTMTDLSKATDTLGYSALVPAPRGNRRFLHNQRLGKVVIKDPDAIDAGYLHYLMRSSEYRHEVLASATGTAVKHTSPERIRRFRFRRPPLSEQRAIAHILGTLEGRIELNRRMSETLEAIARALFKSWFVDFDPVRAKAAGRDPRLPKRVADLFPNSFEESEVGEIPKQWEVRPLGDLLELRYGKALKEEDRHPGSVPVFGSNGQIGWHDEVLAPGPGVVVGRKGNPGIVTWAPTGFFCIDTTFYVVPTEAGRSIHFLFFALAAQDLASQGADSAVPGLNRNLAYMSKQVTPSGSVLDAFDGIVRPLLKRTRQLDEECGTLAALRDALLPKLLAGELRVVGLPQSPGAAS